MNIENRALLLGPTPRSLVEAVKVGDRVLDHSLGKEMRLEGKKIILAPETKVVKVQMGNFIAENLVGEMAIERGLDPGLLFIPSTVGGIENTSEGATNIYLSSDFFHPLYYLNRQDARQRSDVSNGCLYAFSIMTDHLLRNRPKEVPFPTSMDLVDHVADVIPNYLAGNNSESDEKVANFAKEFKNFMVANRHRINFTSQGLRLHVNVDEKRAFSILSGYDQAIRTLLAEPVLELFRSEMAKRHSWFSPDDDVPIGVPRDSDAMKTTIHLLNRFGGIKTLGDILRGYETSDLGAKMGEEIVRTLLVNKHENVDEQEADTADEWEDFEELEPSRPFNLKKKKTKHSGKNLYQSEFDE